MRVACDDMAQPIMYSLAGTNGMSISDFWHAMYTYHGQLARMHALHNVHKMSLHVW